MNRNLTSFDGLIEPVSIETFFADYFKRAPLLIQRSQPDFFKDLLSIKSMADYLERKDLVYPAVRVVKDGFELPLSFYVENVIFGNRSIERISNRKMFKLLGDGATIVGQQLNFSIPSLYPLSEQLVNHFNAKLNINCYLTPSASKAFKPHYDIHEIFVIQVFGSKKWKLYNMPELSPKEQFDMTKWSVIAPTHEFTLNQGDTLYLPGGFIHEAIAVDEPSLHLSIGLSLNETEIQMTGYQDHASSLFDILYLNEISKDTRLRNRMMRTTTIIQTVDCLILEIEENKLRFQLSDKEFLSKLLASNEFMIRELTDHINMEASLQIIRTLVKHGKLEIISIA